MADDEMDVDEDGEELEGDDLTDGLETKKLSGKKLVIIGAAALILIGGGATAFLMMGGEEEHAENSENAEEANLDEDGNPIVAAIVFYDLPEMLVNMNTGSRQASYLKLRVSLELDDPLAIPQLEQLTPRVIDIFQVYLRELRLEDLDGSAGMFRLKEELLKRANASVAPIEVKDILFREMIVQ